MKKIITSLFLLFLPGLAPANYAAPAADTTKSIIWEVSGNGLASPSYLFGILHLICPEDYVWTGVMRDAFHKSKLLCFAEHMKETSGMNEHVLADTTGKKIRDYFSPKDYEDVRAYFLRRANINLDTKQNFNISTMIAWLIKADLGCQDPVAYETRINRLATNEGKKIKIIDDDVEEAGSLEEMPAEKIVAKAIARAHGDSAARVELKKLIETFKQQDQMKLREMLSHLGYYMGETKLDEENDKWMPHIERLMKEQPVFFVFGAAHLGGEHGLISMLRQKGFTVKPSGLEDTASVLDVLPKRAVDLTQYAAEHLKLPQKLIDRHLDGYVTIKLRVTETGKIKQCSVAYGLHPKCNKLVLKMIKKMPPYKPGIKKGKPAEYWIMEKVIIRTGG